MNAMSGADLRERLPLVVTAIAVVIGVVLLAPGLKMIAMV